MLQKHRIRITTIAAFAATALGAAGQDLTTVRVATGLSFPVYLTHAPGDIERVFIVEQAGTVRILKNGTLLPDPFLDLTTITNMDSELGLLGLAFHPDYKNNGHLYVYHTTGTAVEPNTSVVARYTVSDDPDLADPDSRHVLLSFSQTFPNHNGGWIGFGPNDGYLYIASGDGGFRWDPDNNAQTLSNLLGKMLRIDVDGDDWPEDDNKNYAIPPDNPFVGVFGNDEIWSFGLRNPWRNAFDRQTGDLYIADVGQFTVEEINIQPADSPGGENYGWRCLEGNLCTGRSGCTCTDTALTAPDHTYLHDPHCSITGGEVYRGCAMPWLDGTYFFADFCSNDIWSLTRDAGTVQVVDRTDELDPPDTAVAIRMISSFGTDALGEIYICAWSAGEVFKIVPATTANTAPSAIQPPDGAVDARQPFDPDGHRPTTRWNHIDIQLPDCDTEPDANDFTVSETPPAQEKPAIDITAAEPLQSAAVRLQLSRPPANETTMTLQHLPTLIQFQFSVLPGDVDANGVVNGQDAAALISLLDNPGAAPGWTTDIDVSNAFAPPDLLRLLDLLNGAQEYRAYLDATLP